MRTRQRNSVVVTTVLPCARTRGIGRTRSNVEKMKRHSACLAIVLSMTGLLLLPPYGADASEPDAKTITLAGRTRFVASKTSSIFVRFPRPVDRDDGWDVDVRGTGRMYGFLMRDTRGADGEAGEIVGTASGRCSEPGCKGSRAEPSVTGFNVAPTLEGAWELYVVADDNPVTVTITLKGVKGARTERVEGLVDSSIETLPMHAAASNDGHVYSAGAFTDVARGRPDYGTVTAWMRGTNHQVTAFGDCTYYDSMYFGLMPAPPDPIAFAPGCPTSYYKNPRAHYASSAEEDFWFSSGSFGPVHGLGGWFVTDAAVTSAGAVAFWLDY